VILYFHGPEASRRQFVPFENLRPRVGNWLLEIVEYTSEVSRSHGRKFEPMDDQTKDSSFGLADQKFRGKRDPLPSGRAENVKVEHGQG